MTVSALAHFHSEVEKVRRELVAIYRRHNETKVPEVDGLLAKYPGQEAKLLKLAREKYEPGDEDQEDRDL